MGSYWITTHFMYVILFVALVGLLMYTIKLTDRINTIEKTLQHHKLMEGNAFDSGDSNTEPLPQNFAPQLVERPLSDIPAPPKPNAFIEWLKEDFLVKLGGLLLLIAFGWFVSYAFANNWIGPAGRITLGLLFGLILMVLGVWRIRVAKHQGAIFTVLGNTTVLLTIFAARELYGFFTPTSALFVMFLSVAFTAFVSVRYQRQQLAIAGLILGAIAPLFTAAPTPDITGNSIYLAAIVLGTIWVVFLTGWSILTPLALLVVALYTSPYLSGYKYQDTALLFAFGYTALFFATNIVSTVRRQGKNHLIAQVLTGIFTTIYLVFAVVMAVSESMQSLVFVFWALAFALGAYFVYVFTDNRLVFYLYGASGIALIGIATAAELSGPALTIAYIVEIGLLMFVSVAKKLPFQVTRYISFLFAIPVIMSFESIGSRAWRDGIMHGDFMVVLLITTVSLIVGIAMFDIARRLEDKLAQSAALTFLVLGIFYAATLVWLVSHAILSDSAGTTISLIIYTITGLAMFIQGKQSDSAFLRYIGMTFIGVVVARLMLVDVWSMPISGRIITFFIIGVMLISTAFLNKLRPSENEE